MLREIRVKKGRDRVVPFLRSLVKLQLVSEASAHLAILRVVFGELSISAKEVKK